MANAQFNTFSVTTTAKELLVGNTRRRGYELDNASGVIIFSGFTNGVTTSNGFRLLANEKYHNSGDADNYRGPVFVIVATGTADLRFREWGA